VTYTDTSIIQLFVTLGGTLALAIPFGLYIARMNSYEIRPLERPLAKIENGFFRLIGIDVNRQMTWKEYFFAIIITNGIVAAFCLNKSILTIKSVELLE
jgi:potassium-transporting ATPase potassium-binding subunit